MDKLAQMSKLPCQQHVEVLWATLKGKRSLL